MTLVRYFPRLVRDRLGRFAFFLGACALLVGPPLAGLRFAVSAMSAAGGEAAAGFRDGLAIMPQVHPMAGLIGFMLAAGTLLFWEGIIARDRRDGTFRPLLARPISRPGYYLACWLASLLCLAAGALVLGGATAWAGDGLGRPFSPAGTATAAVAYALVLGSPVFLASAWLDRGDALVAIALALVAPALERLSAAGWSAAGPLLRALRPALPPLDRLEDVRDALFAGSLPAAADAAVVAGWGIGLLAAGLLSLRHGEFRTH